MANRYVSPWMSGNDALVHLRQVLRCDDPTAFRLLQQACRSRDLDGRGCGEAHEWQKNRGFDRGDEAWRSQFSSAVVPPNKLHEYLETCEFCRKTVKALWAITGDERDAYANESGKGEQADVAAPSAAAPMRTKRKTNGQDYRPLDAPLVTEMRTLIEAGTAISPEDAARAVVDRATGAGQGASKVKRLALRYRNTYPVQPVE